MASESAVRKSLFALGIELDGEGYHPRAWRRAGHEPTRFLSPRRLRAQVAAAENAGFTFATFDDSIVPAGEIAGRIDAIGRASFVAATTSTLGLVPVVAATYAEPFHISSQLATLDYASRGRAGWLAADDPETARTWGATPRVTETEIRRERDDSVEVARRLWDSWEDDAVVRDYAAGKFLNRDRLHHIDFIGETFSVKGPSIVPRPPQGQVVVFGYGTAQSGIDVALVSGAHTPDAVAAVQRARESGAARGLVDLTVALDTPTETAAERLADLGADALPNHPERLHFSGSPDNLVALLTDLSAHADGVRLHPAVLDEDLTVLARYVLPALLRAGIAHRPVPGSTLRANLGLSRPADRYAKELTR
ncbi:MAG: Alkanesulfonate monooxygenase [Nocardia sp.]|uniref:LLM class flavin-dependent oxidoreductase n=1 Tax=Nocardia sp. TaxID=1821 RepID=UPI00261E6FD0|nr:LLM class flavin-dependent oxidoreductase [Nocardia sp.]MCU1639820.1 Alkanesulfonate monooxygenase [Nocardia sp.]